MGTKDYTTGKASIGEHWTIVSKTEWGHMGIVITPFGMVFVCSEYSWTSVKFFYRGKIHSRFWSEAFARKTLVTLAKRFAKEICEGS